MVWCDGRAATAGLHVHGMCGRAACSGMYCSELGAVTRNATLDGACLDNRMVPSH